DLVPAAHGERAPVVVDRLGAMFRRALLHLLERAVLLVDAHRVAILAIFDLLRRALLPVAQWHAGACGHFVAPRLLLVIAVFLDLDDALPAMAGDRDLRRLRPDEQPPDPEAEQRDADEHVRPDPPLLDRDGRLLDALHFLR